MFNRSTPSRVSSFVVIISLVATIGGCTSYAVPGKGANITKLGMTDDARDRQTDPDIRASIEKRPLAQFPATVAIVRVEAGNYQPRTVQLYGDGSYRVVLTRDVEKPEMIERLRKLPQLAGLEPINRLALPERLTSDRELRTAAATLHADMVLIYTFDDTFDDRDLASWMTLLTAGVSPTKYLNVSSTVSAVLVDTRNGYIYGVAEATHKKGTLANCWGETAAADAVRAEVESVAFEKLVPEIETTWKRVLTKYSEEKPKT